MTRTLQSVMSLCKYLRKYITITNKKARLNFQVEIKHAFYVGKYSFIFLIYSCAKAISAALSVAEITSSLCCAETKPASNADGAK